MSWVLFEKDRLGYFVETRLRTGKQGWKRGPRQGAGVVIQGRAVAV